MKGRIVLLFISIALILGLALPAVAAAPQEIPGNGPPNLERIVLVHHAKDFPAGNPHGTPPGQDKEKPGGGKDDEGGKLWYKTNGWHWGDGSVEYWINDTDMSDEFVAAIKASFAVWDEVSETYQVNYVDTTDVLPDTRGIDAFGYEIPDEVNVVGWKDLGATGTIGITYIWYNTITLEFVDVDTALNSNLAYQWWQNESEASWPQGNDSNAYDVDFQNIMTHEAGHWIFLDDLRNKPASQQTMYGISAEFELKKRSLESGDIAGVLEIYPTP